MATYEFSCPTCENSVTIAQSIKENLETPICGGCGYRMIRSYQISGLEFRGLGWGRDR